MPELIWVDNGVINVLEQDNQEDEIFGLPTISMRIVESWLDEEDFYPTDPYECALEILDMLTPIHHHHQMVEMQLLPTLHRQLDRLNQIWEETTNEDLEDAKPMMKVLISTLCTVIYNAIVDHVENFETRNPGVNPYPKPYTWYMFGCESNPVYPWQYAAAA